MLTETTIEVEVVPPVDAQLVKFADTTGLEKPATQTLVEAFRPIYAKARAALEDARGVAESVKDATCVREIMRSRACRLALRKIRLESDETREKQKAHALLFGKAVQGFHNILMADIVPVETALQEAEDFAERAEAARLSALRAAREAELGPLLDTPIFGDLSELSDTHYAKLVADAKLLRQAKIEAAAKAEAERLAKEEADRVERARIASENERLKAEAVETARLVEIERQRLAKVRTEELAQHEADRKRVEAERAEERRKADAEAAAEKERQAEAMRKFVAAQKAEADRLAEIAAKERDALKAKADAELAKQMEITRKQQAEAKRLKDELAAKAKAEATEKVRVEAERAATAEAARLAAAAPDAAKLQAFAQQVRELHPPELSNQQVLGQVFEQIAEFATWVEAQIPRL